MVESMGKTIWPEEWGLVDTVKMGSGFMGAVALTDLPDRFKGMCM
jgi:hypothetical protein